MSDLRIDIDAGYFEDEEDDEDTQCHQCESLSDSLIAGLCPYCRREEYDDEG